MYVTVVSIFIFADNDLKQLLILTHSTIEVHDCRTFRRVEYVNYEATSLASPLRSLNTSTTVHFEEPTHDVAHSLRIYKGKIFLLVSFQRVDVHTVDVHASPALTYKLEH